MPTYVVLTRLTPEAAEIPGDLKRLERAVSTQVRTCCPEVTWRASYAILGAWDYLDVFEAPDETTAAKVVTLIKSFGHAQTETWTAIPRPGFEHMLSCGAEGAFASDTFQAAVEGALGERLQRLHDNGRRAGTARRSGV